MADRAETLLAEAEEVRARLDMVSRQLDLLASLKEDKSRAHQTLLGMQGASPGDEILFPVGGNTFVAAKLGDNQTVIKGIGAEYALQRPLDKAIAELKAEMDTLDADLQNVTRMAQQLEDRYAQLTQILQDMGAVYGNE